MKLLDQWIDHPATIRGLIADGARQYRRETMLAQILPAWPLNGDELELTRGIVEALSARVVTELGLLHSEHWTASFERLLAAAEALDAETLTLNEQLARRLG